MSRPLLPHHRQHGARHVHGPDEARPELGVDLLRAQFLEEAGMEARGVVHEHVDAPEPLDGGSHGRLRVAGAHDVEAHDQEPLGRAEFAKALATDPELRGPAAAKVETGPDGRPTRVTFRGEPARSGLELCVADVLVQGLESQVEGATIVIPSSVPSQALDGSPHFGWLVDMRCTVTCRVAIANPRRDANKERGRASEPGADR